MVYHQTHFNARVWDYLSRQVRKEMAWARTVTPSGLKAMCEVSQNNVEALRTKTAQDIVVSRYNYFHHRASFALKGLYVDKQARELWKKLTGRYLPVVWG